MAIKMDGAYLVSPIEDNGRAAVIGPFADRDAAVAAASKNDYVVGHEADVIWSGSTLVEMFNGISGAHVKKFESRDAGVRRLLAAIPVAAAASPAMELETISNNKETQIQKIDEDEVSDLKKPRKSKNAERDALAASGVFPEKPIVTSPTNMHRQKHFDVLAHMASEGEWDKIRAFQMRGVDSYSKDINRYRDRLLMAHETSRAVE